MKNILSIGEPQITGYLHHVFPLAILAANDAYLPWFYSNYIQLRRFVGRDLNFYLHPFHRTFSTCPGLEIQTIDKTIVDGSYSDIIHFIFNCIDNQFYVQIDVNFFFVSDREQYEKQHFLHEILIIGYDDKEEVFHITGLGKKGHFSCSKMTFSDFRKSLSTSRMLYLKEFVKLGWGQAPHWFEEKWEVPKIYLFRYKNETNFEFDLESVVEQFKDYLNSFNSSKRFRVIAKYRDDSDVWGMATYNYLISSIEGLMKQHDSWTSVYSLRIFWEHKKCMFDRIRYMEQRGIIDPSGCFSEAYEIIQKKAYEVHLIMLWWTARKRDKSLSQAIGLLKEISKLEYRGLYALIEELELSMSTRAKDASTSIFSPEDQIL